MSYEVVPRSAPLGTWPGVQAGADVAGSAKWIGLIAACIILFVYFSKKD